MNIDTFKVEKWMNEYEKYSKYDLGNTTVQNFTLEELFELTNTDKSEFLQKISTQKLGYGDILGNPAFKKGICTLYKNLLPSEVLTTIGASGANHLVFYSLIEPQDEVISVIPTYQQLYSIPKSFGAEVHHLHLKPKNKFLPDLEKLESLVNKKTKMICLNNPNNPTGAVIPENMLQEIIKIAEKTGAYILCDEVYRGLNQNDEKTPSIVDMYDKGISTSGMSKVFSLAGLRLGWAAAKDKNILEQLKTHREYNMISCSVTDETLATLALEHSDKIIKRNKKIIKESLDILDNWVTKEDKIHYIKPKAGTTALIYYDLDMKSDEVCRRLAKEKGVFLTPGNCFELENCFRIGYCTGKEGLKQGLEKISEFISQQKIQG